MIDPFKYQLSVSTSVPSEPIEGDIYYNTIDCVNYIYQNNKWMQLTFHSDVWTDRSGSRKKKIKNIYEL